MPDKAGVNVCPASVLSIEVAQQIAQSRTVFLVCHTCKGSGDQTQTHSQCCMASDIREQARQGWCICRSQPDDYHLCNSNGHCSAPQPGTQQLIAGGPFNMMLVELTCSGIAPSGSCCEGHKSDTCSAPNPPSAPCSSFSLPSPPETPGIAEFFGAQTQPLASLFSGWLLSHMAFTALAITNMYIHNQIRAELILPAPHHHSVRFGQHT